MNKKVTISLPRYVVRTPRTEQKDCPIDFYFKVPARLRPEGWAPSIRLPIDSADRTRKACSGEIAAIMRDANKLNQQLDRRRSDGLRGALPKDTLPALWQAYVESDDWPKSKSSQAVYKSAWRNIDEWSASKKHSSITLLTWPFVYKFIKKFSPTPEMQKMVRIVLRKLLQMAADEGIIEASPFAGNDSRRKWSNVKSDYNVQVWELEHVMEAVRIFDEAGDYSLSLATLIGFDMMQYPQQISGFRRNEHYDPKTGEFMFNRNKTGVPCRAPCLNELRRRLAENSQLYLVINEKTGRPYSDQVLAPKFRRGLKDYPKLASFQMRWLRHSGVFEARRAGIDLPTIADIGGWQSSSAVQAVIDKHYRMPDGVLATKGQEAREAYRNETATKSFTE